MTESTSRLCPGCSVPASGNFCSTCGASLGHRTCAACRAELSAKARYCHRCGLAAGVTGTGTSSSTSDRKAWTIAGVLCVVLVAGIVYQVSSAAPEPTAPDMANAGVSTGSPPSRIPGPAGPAPDISSMTPREQFDRLFNRIMQAAERKDSAEVRRFTPMALGAYRQLDTVDADARYHAAVLHLQVGDWAAGSALADTILAHSPGHLFAYLIRGEAANLSGDKPTRAESERDFLAQYPAEMAAKRVEYLEHQPALEEFKKQAEESKRSGD